MFKFLKKIFIGLLASIVNASNHTIYVSLSNHKRTTQPTLINLHPKTSKTLTKHISCEYKCSKMYSRKCNSNQKWNNDKC